MNGPTQVRDPVVSDGRLLVGFHMPNHAELSGYDRLADYIRCDYLDGRSLPFGAWRWDRLTSGLRSVNLALLELESWRREPRYGLVHALYADIHVRWSLAPRPGVVRVATVHLPIDRLASATSGELRQRFRRLASASGIIALSSAEAAAISAKLPSVNVEFIPHGVDSRVFVPAISKSHEGTYDIAVIGTNYRDITVLEEVVRNALTGHPTWRFRLFGARGSAFERLATYRNVAVEPRLGARDYLAALHDVDVQFLPLTFATANNALLEAHAIGIPSVVSRIPGVTDYALPTTLLVDGPRDAVRALEQIEARLANEGDAIVRETRALGARFHWPNVASAVEKFYERLLERTVPVVPPTESGA